MRRPLLTWCAGIGTAAAAYIELDRRYDGWTFSEAIRPAAREHPALFTVGLIGLAAWFWRHILRRPLGLADQPRTASASAPAAIT